MREIIITIIICTIFTTIVFIETQPDKYIVQIKEVIDTVYAETLYDTTIVTTYYFNNPMVALVNNSEFQGSLVISSDSIIDMVGISYCNFTMTEGGAGINFTNDTCSELLENK